MITKTSDSIKNLSEAMAKFQADVKQPLKDKTNPYFKSKYVPLESVVDAITKEASKQGISFFQWACNDDTGRVGVATLVTHKSGEFIEFSPLFMNAEKNNAQGAGALLTYLRRYTLSAIFGITSDEDDDGNAASAPKSTPRNLATDEEIALLKERIIKFTEMFRNATETSVKKELGISDYRKMTSNDIGNAINKLDDWSK